MLAVSRQDYKEHKVAQQDAPKILSLKRLNNENDFLRSYFFLIQSWMQCMWFTELDALKGGNRRRRCLTGYSKFLGVFFFRFDIWICAPDTKSWKHEINFKVFLFKSNLYSVIYNLYYYYFEFLKQYYFKVFIRIEEEFRFCSHYVF